jgi:hypothetical protein
MALVIIFYASDGMAAKQASQEIVATKQNHARVYDVAAWNDSHDQCDHVIIMPDVPEWQRVRIEEIFGDKIVRDEEDHNELKAEEQGEQVDGDGDPPKEKDPEENNPARKFIKHQGGGRWFVMLDNERLSGPHSKEEAQRKLEEV